MKYSNQLIGLPIISLSNGIQVGNVKTLVINPDSGTVDFLTVEHEDWQVSVKAAPYKKIIGVGDFAVTIESEVNIIDLTEIPIANTLVSKNIKINGTKVMTRLGQLIGVVNEYYINSKTGEIIGIEVVQDEVKRYLSTELIFTFGKDILVVSEDAEQSFHDNPEQLIKAKEQDSVEIVKEKQADLLIGKVLLTDVTDKKGNPLFKKGSVLTKEMIATAQNKGPLVMAELTMNAGDK
jgi:uncharacterized protein YrrD